MSEETQILTRWVDPTIDDFKIALEEANKQIEEDNKEIERLNNIINELEKYLEDYHNNTGLGEYETGIDDAICDTIKKLKKLKGDSSNETNNNRL